MTISEAAVAALLDECIDALQHEREHIIRGDLAGLAEDSEAREARLAKLESLKAPISARLQRRIERLRADAERNAGLLQAAMKGVQAGRRKIEEMVAARHSLASYDASGAAVDRLARTTHEKRY